MDTLLYILKELDGNSEHPSRMIKYNGNLYVIDCDLDIQADTALYTEDGKQVDYLHILPGANYHCELRYLVKKGFKTIDEFKTRKEAEDFVSAICEKIGGDYDE